MLVSQPEGRNGPWFILNVRTIDRAPTTDRRLARFLHDETYVGLADPLGDTTFIGGGPMREMYGHPSYSGGWWIQGFDGFSTPGTINITSVLAGTRLFTLEVREHNGTPTPEVRDAFINSLQIIEPVLPTAAPAQAE